MEEIAVQESPDGTLQGSKSERRLTANRRNALKSTGPRSADGKGRSRWNALKHGLLARTVTIDGGLCAERQSDFEKLHEVFREELRPVGPLEEMLVERIVTCYWRLRRAQIAEIGETRKHLDMAFVEPGRARTKTYWREKKYLTLDSTRDRLEENSMFVKAQIEALDDTIKDVEKNGRISEFSRERLLVHFGFDEDSWIQLLPALQHMAEHGPLEGEDPKTIPSPEDCREKLRLILIDQKERFERFLKIVNDRELWTDEAHMKACHLPDRLALDKILRYETTIERQMYRALDQLERLQRHREGESVPPPLTINTGM